MSVSTISPPTSAATQSGHHAHHAHAKGGGASGTSGSSSTKSTADAKANESIEQLAAEGDPTAIAELKAEQVKPPSPGQDAQSTAAQPHTGAKEPGKGDEVDVYV